jgi:hypothetical protein
MAKRIYREHSSAGTFHAPAAVVERQDKIGISSGRPTILGWSEVQHRYSVTGSAVDAQTVLADISYSEIVDIYGHVG